MMRCELPWFSERHRESTCNSGWSEIMGGCNTTDTMLEIRATK